MANSAKAKGDRAELEAVRVLLDLVPDLCVPKAQRMLGAGRREDVGDLHVFSDVAIQVRNYAMPQLGTAIRSAAADSFVQAGNAPVRLDFALGMVPVPRAQATSVRWLATTLPDQWPGGTPVSQSRHPVEFPTVSRMLTWVRDDEGPYGYEARPRMSRMALLTGPGQHVLVAPIEAWLADYRIARLGIEFSDAARANVEPDTESSRLRLIG